MSESDNDSEGEPMNKRDSERVGGRMGVAPMMNVHASEYERVKVKINRRERNNKSRS